LSDVLYSVLFGRAIAVKGTTGNTWIETDEPENRFKSYKKCSLSHRDRGNGCIMLYQYYMELSVLAIGTDTFKCRS
jgi:hypothetical protein